MSRLSELTRVFREIRAVHLNDYYSELYEGSDLPYDGRTWGYDFSTGIKLDAEGREMPDHPVLFMKFHTRDGVPVARVPVTVAALLECRAMASEVRLRIGLIDDLPAEAQLIERGTYPDSLKRLFYDPLMTQYTVVAHYFANIFGVNDILTALLAAGRLAWVVLNLHDDLFDGIKVPESFSVWGNRNAAALRQRDRGYVYGMILENCKPPWSGHRVDDGRVIDRMLAASGLPDEAAIYKDAVAARSDAYADLADGPFTGRFRDLTRHADRYGADLAAAAHGGVGLGLGVLPPIFTAEGNILRLSNASEFGTFAQPGAWIDRASLIHNQFDEFINACVV